MTSSKDRSILGVIAISVAIFIIYFLFSLPNKTIHSPFFLSFVPTLISGFNVIILFVSISLGMVAGGIVLALALVAVVLIDVRMELHNYSFLVLQFFITLFIGYAFTYAAKRCENEYILKAEKLEEDTNIISNDIQENRKNVFFLEEKLKKYSTLKESVEELSTVLSSTDIDRRVVERAAKTIGKPGRVLLYLVDTEKQNLMLSASRGGPRVKAKRGDIFDHWVFRHRKPLIVEDVAKDFRFPADELEEARKVFRSLISVPLVSEDKIIGILRMDSPKEITYAQEDLRLLDIIADLSAVAIQNAVLYSRTQELAMRDGLTGLFVRRYFMERFQEEINRAAMKKGVLSLLMLDIDNFKAYNDKFGHTAGDLVLRHLAKTVSGMIEEGDMVARYGGEEIVILLPGRDKKTAFNEAEKIRKAVGERSLVLRRQQANISASIGVASYPEDGVTGEDIINAADGSLYKAKSGGRNRVC